MSSHGKIFSASCSMMSCKLVPSSSKKKCAWSSIERTFFMTEMEIVPTCAFDHREPPFNQQLVDQKGVGFTWSTFSSNLIHREVSLQTESLSFPLVSSRSSIKSVGGSTSFFSSRFRSSRDATKNNILNSQLKKVMKKLFFLLHHFTIMGVAPGIQQSPDLFS